MYKEHTPPPFSESEKEVPSLKLTNTGLQTESGLSEEVNTLHQGTETITGAIPVRARTSFRAVEQGEEEEEEEEYISLNIDGKDYGSVSSESSNCINPIDSRLGLDESDMSDMSEEEDYFVL